MAKQLKVKILKNIQVAPHAYKMSLSSQELAKSSLPGQFVMVRTIDSNQPLLRRPFGIHSVKGSNVDILYELAGAGTKILSRKKTGEYLNLLGPLGSGFNLTNKKPILIAGGMGVAPLVYLAERLKKLKPVVLLGAKTKSHILCEKEFKALGCDVKIATDDGSSGYKGFVTDLLKNSPLIAKCQASTIYACGPKPMLKSVTAAARQCNIAAQVSLEEHMACGIGACLGCVINTTHGQKRVCKDGPVFNAEKIVWED